MSSGFCERWTPKCSDNKHELSIDHLWSTHLTTGDHEDIWIQSYTSYKGKRKPERSVKAWFLFNPDDPSSNFDCRHNSGSGAKTGDAQKCQIHRVADKCSSLSGRWLRAHGMQLLRGLFAALHTLAGCIRYGHSTAARLPATLLRPQSPSSFSDDHWSVHRGRAGPGRRHHRSVRVVFGLLVHFSRSVGTLGQWQKKGYNSTTPKLVTDKVPSVSGAPLSSGQMIVVVQQQTPDYVAFFLFLLIKLHGFLFLLLKKSKRKGYFAQGHVPSFSMSWVSKWFGNVYTWQVLHVCNSKLWLLFYCFLSEILLWNWTSLSGSIIYSSRGNETCLVDCRYS